MFEVSIDMEPNSKTLHRFLLDDGTIIMKDTLERLLLKDTGKDTGKRTEYRVAHKLTWSHLQCAQSQRQVCTGTGKSMLSQVLRI